MSASNSGSRSVQVPPIGGIVSALAQTLNVTPKSPLARMKSCRVGSPGFVSRSRSGSCAHAVLHHRLVTRPVGAENLDPPRRCQIDPSAWLTDRRGTAPTLALATLPAVAVEQFNDPRSRGGGFSLKLRGAPLGGELAGEHLRIGQPAAKVPCGGRFWDVV